ncbi:hypothetical protein PoB_001502400 [Plakobranchus ocellatus]|uniref:Uncharacterized protein n=1 Tax=Plakobranchus ocellatus TaxID=259542 RepID=A0AAV3Z289_9GAST|nr:hypothetical protein PoB_001502400 [Plakobranchus ocellatus]
MVEELGGVTHARCIKLSAHPKDGCRSAPSAPPNGEISRKTLRLSVLREQQNSTFWLCARPKSSRDGEPSGNLSIVLRLCLWKLRILHPQFERESSTCSSSRVPISSMECPFPLKISSPSRCVARQNDSHARQTLESDLRLPGSLYSLCGVIPAHANLALFMPKPFY